MPEFIVFQELHEEQVLEQPMGVSAFVVVAANAKAAIEAVSAFAAFLPGQAIGSVEIESRDTYEAVGAPTLKKKTKKPK